MLSFTLVLLLSASAPASDQGGEKRFRLVLDALLQSPGLPFADVLSEESIAAVFQEEGVTFATEDDAVYTPAVTLWAFLSQMLSMAI